MNFFRSSVFISVLIFSFSIPLFSQTVTIGGVVRDSATTSFIDSVKVEIINPANLSEKYLVYTNSTGKWSYTFQSSGVENNESVPTQFELQQNFPNPFNPSTIIPFSLHRAGEVTLSVHNIVGQKLSERSFDLSSGTYNIRWNSNGAAGVLFYTLHFNGQSVTRKMIQLDGNHSGGFGDAVLVGGFASSSSFGKKSAAEFLVRTSKIGYEADSVVVPNGNNQNINFSLSSVHHRAFVFDLHNDIAELMVNVNWYQLGIRNTNTHSDIPRFIDGGIDAQMIVLWSDPGDFPTTSYQRTIQMYDTCIAQFNRNSSTIAIAKSTSEIQSVHASGKIAAVLCSEGGHAIEENLNNLRMLYHLGARYLTITWNNSISWAVSAADAQSTTKGLSEFGKDVIRTMDSLGMIIDVSHTGMKTIEDILLTTKNPIIASHSGVRALRNHTRNLTDDQIKAIANGGGVIGVVFHKTFITSTTTATIDTVIKHIDYIKNLVGINHVAIGSDYDGGITPPVGLENVSKMPNLTMALLRRGYSPVDVRKILGENYLRVFKSVCH